MDTTQSEDFPQVMHDVARMLAEHPDPRMVAFFERCARDDERDDALDVSRRDRSLLRFARILTELTPFTADAVDAETDKIRRRCPDGMDASEADAVERAAEGFAAHCRATRIAATRAGFKAGSPRFDGDDGEIDMVQPFRLDGDETLALHVHLDLADDDVTVSLEHTDTGAFDYPDDERGYAAIFDAARADVRV